MTEEEQQAAMALKLMDNVKQLIVDTVTVAMVEDSRLRAVARVLTDEQLRNTDQYGTLAQSVRRIIQEQMGKH